MFTQINLMYSIIFGKFLFNKGFQKFKSVFLSFCVKVSRHKVKNSGYHWRDAKFAKTMIALVILSK